jgi:Pyruvate phosphate dikinase, AMP/ATP-binding domain
MQATVRTNTEADIQIVPLAQAGSLREVGGKASRLGALMAKGERVPDGFCVIGSGARAATLALEAYRRLGADVPVAVRSSASAEDGSEASFAGQFASMPMTSTASSPGSRRRASPQRPRRWTSPPSSSTSPSFAPARRSGACGAADRTRSSGPSVRVPR